MLGAELGDIGRARHGHGSDSNANDEAADIDCELAPGYKLAFFTSHIARLPGDAVIMLAPTMNAKQLTMRHFCLPIQFVTGAASPAPKKQPACRIETTLPFLSARAVALSPSKPKSCMNDGNAISPPPSPCRQPQVSACILTVS